MSNPEQIKRSIEQKLAQVSAKNRALSEALTDTISLTSYAPEGGCWTKALQQALSEHEVVLIPASDLPYRLDGSVTIPSNRRIIAEDGAVISLTESTNVLMLRNTNTEDGTHMPIRGVPRNENIWIEGGIWEESRTRRMGYGQSGMYDEDRSLFGVSTCMFFENMNGLTLRNMTFRRCAGFAVQLGEIKDVIIENIHFEQCYADGIHINGNTENVLVRDLTGVVGDDLVAFNMFDWQNSSVNFGPCDTVLCEDIDPDTGSICRAMRIEPGIYTFKDGSRVDCSLTNAIFRRIHNIRTYKLYCQTPVYYPQNGPEPADTGSGDNIFFEDLAVELDSPIDGLPPYMEGDPVTGSCAAFELGLNVKDIYFKNIDVTLHRDAFPRSYFICIGPKSVRLGEAEVFDPYLSSTADHIHLENITINGTVPKDITPYIREIVFDNLYDDIPSTASGKINRVTYDGKDIIL